MSTTDASTEFLSLQSVVAGRYSLEREIGRGGMGIVFLARDVALDRPVAIKLLPPALAADSEFRQRFVQEARTAAGLSHPNIVPIHAVEEHGDLVFFVMTFVDGETLQQRVERRGPLCASEAVRLIQEVAWALTLAHAKGIVHRDVKPDNILIDKATERAMVTDFGIARVAAVKGTANAAEIIGTAHYMSPEQASGEEVDARSDIYSLGITAFFALTGAVPFDAPTLPGILAKHVTEPAPATASVRFGIPTRLGDAVDRCLAKDPTARFQSGEELAQAVAAVGLASREVPPPVRRFLGVVGVTILLFTGVPLVAFMWTVWPVWELAYWFLLMLGLELLVATRMLLRSGWSFEDVRAARAKLRVVDEQDRLFSEDQGFTPFQKAVIPWLRALFRPFRILDRLGNWLGVRFGPVLFRVAGIGLSPRLRPAPPTIERTEIWLAGAVDAIFNALPREYRSRLTDVPQVIRHLQAHAQNLRKRRHELDRVLALARSEDATVDRARPDPGVVSIAELEAAAATANERLATVVAALENIRLDLFRLSTGQGSVDDLTADLEAARAVGEDIDRLVAGQGDVAGMVASERTIPR
jgi:predicted Ser/Thr protein kinase